MHEIYQKSFAAQPVSSIKDLRLNGVMSAKAGAYSSFAVTTDHALWAWGQNHGRFGDGTTSASSSVPVQITTLSQVQRLSAGLNHTAAILGTALRTWGFNADGELGDGTFITRASPIQVDGNLIVRAPYFIGAGGGAGVCVDAVFWLPAPRPGSGRL
jgi:alpha-tubulin suppressor-like RCC1 family protein